MPNNITTSVEIVGPKDKISKLIEDTKIKLDVETVDNQFDFNGIIPMPPELRITSGSSTDMGMAAFSKKAYDKESSYGWFADRYTGVTDPESLRKFLENQAEDGNLSETDRNFAKLCLKEGKQAIENLEKYGFKDWYDWANDKWGTKWNAYDVRYLAHDENHLVLEITTAWDTPREIWDKLEEMGFEVNGIISGEMEGTDTLGSGGPFYTNISVDFGNDFTPYTEE